MAPICLFVYNRPQETSLLLDSLINCVECKDSDLIVFGDGPKTDEDKVNVDKVHSLFYKIKGFKSVTLHFRDENQGLAQSVIQGINAVFESYDSVIVLEDDLIVSKDFLSFMNDSLATYHSRADIWSISGYTPSIEIPSDYSEDTFLVQRPQCWGWATWKDRWMQVDWDARDASVLKDRKQRRSFNLGGNDLSRTMAIWEKGYLDAWAIRWVFSAWIKHSWTLNPVHSKIKNVGFSNAATHRGWNDKRHYVEISSKIITLNPEIQPDQRIIDAFKAHHDLGLVSRVGYFLRLHNLGYKQIKRLFR